jgi:glutamate-1-semialdehyde 2,1-aminomutase
MSKLDTSKSTALFDRACHSIPGGVNSPVRAFRAVGGHPLFIKQAAGAHITDADGNTFIDYVGSWGPMILGHAHPEVVKAVQAAAEQGMSFGAPTEAEIGLAEEVKALMPSIELIRMVSSGTEATMSAIRLARGFTSRNAIVKFDGCYHGHTDSLLVKAGSGLATLGTPDSAGVPPDLARDTIVLPYNDLYAVEALFEERGAGIAAAIVEPIAGNMGCVSPKAGFLECLRDATARSGSVLIFDEVITGFRASLGGAQEIFGVQPDLTCLGKIIGGGLPVGAFGGRTDIMEQVAPLGPVYQAGTLSGNPIAMAAGLATVRLLKELNPYAELARRAARLAHALHDIAADAGVQCTVNQAGSVFTMFFNPGPVTDWTTSKVSDTARYARFFRAMLDEGVYLAPSQFECGFLGIAHTDELIDQTIEAAKRAVTSVDG